MFGVKMLSKIDPNHHETKGLCFHWPFLMYFLRSLLQANKSFIPPSAPSVHQSNVYVAARSVRSDERLILAGKCCGGTTYINLLPVRFTKHSVYAKAAFLHMVSFVSKCCFLYFSCDSCKCSCGCYQQPQNGHFFSVAAWPIVHYHWRACS